MLHWLPHTLYHHHNWLNSPWWALAFLRSFAHSSLLRATFFQFFIPNILIHTLYTSINSYLASFNLLGGHDYDTGVLLPHHVPEIWYCGRQTTLCCNVVLGVSILEHFLLWLQQKSNIWSVETCHWTKLPERNRTRTCFNEAWVTIFNIFLPEKEKTRWKCLQPVQRKKYSELHG